MTDDSRLHAELQSAGIAFDHPQPRPGESREFGERGKATRVALDRDNFRRRCRK